MSSSSDWIQLKRQLEREFFAGGIAGSVGIFIGFPLDMVKVKLQVFPDQYKSAWQCLKQSVQEEGFTGLYRGCLPPILIQGLINSLMFVGESLATKVLEPNLKAGEIGSPVNTYLAGMAGGVLQCVALVPSEVIKCSMQTEVGGNTTQSEFQRTASCVRNIYRNEGLVGLYRGWNATVLRETPSIGMYFFSYKYSKEALTNMQGLKEANDAAIMVAGGIAGAMSWSLVYPFDVIKTIIQSTPANSNGESLTVMGTARSLYRRYGYSIFFRGLGTTIVRAFPVNASTFFCYEKLKHLLHLEHMKEDQEFDGLYR